MTLGAYFLNGVSGDSILVFKDDDPETLLRIITKLKASRDREIRAVADKLELEWYRREHKGK